MKRALVVAAALLSLATVTSGCSRSPRVSFYTLESGAAVQTPAAAQPTPAVSVGPVTLPESVDRPQLVVRVAANRVEILESHRWAEPLKSEIPRLVAQSLGKELNSSRVVSHQQHGGTAVDYRVLLDIVRLEAEPGNAVTVESNWTIRRSGTLPPLTGRSLVQEKVARGGYQALVASLSRALVGVSADIAQAIRAEEAAKARRP